MGLHVIAPLSSVPSALSLRIHLCTGYAYPVDNLVYNLRTVCAISVHSGRTLHVFVNEKCIGLESGSFVVSRHHVGIDLERHRDVGVPDPLRHDLDRHASSQCRGRVTVPQVVEPDRAQPGPGDECVEQV